MNEIQEKNIIETDIHEYKTLELSNTNVITTIFSIIQKLKDKFENVGRKLTIINSDRVDLTKNKLKLQN